MDNETATQIAMAQNMREKLDQMTAASISSATQGVRGINPNTAVAGRGQYGPLGISININDAENGRVVTLGRKIYVCPQDTPLLEVIGQALVEAQLEK